jgi:hypothetical protein
VNGRRSEQYRLAEWCADKLNPNRQASIVESRWYADRRQS